MSFGPATALRQWPHTTSMKPSTRLVSEPKSGAILVALIPSVTLTKIRLGIIEADILNGLSHQLQIVRDFTVFNVVAKEVA